MIILNYIEIQGLQSKGGYQYGKLDITVAN